ncbi:MAG: zinc metallopeptidase [Oscillospiraceae bacterium]|nr:zinc metallopeptidase [Oscillospiraceae bacterium]HAO69322.1 peptidase [Oscillospiraceae bacterium]
MFYNLFDPYYWILIVPSLLLALWAQMMVSSNFKKYSQVYNRRGYTGADAARMILDSNGLYHVRIERVSGNLTDHYDPKAEVIRLSDSVYGSASVAAVGVAAHEAGHAVQHATGYLPIKIRSAIIPVTQIGSQLSIPLILLGFLFQLKPLVFVGILFYATAALFQLVTLPVEFNASSRAMKVLEQSEMLAGDELAGAGKVLRAAAMTYVAALLTALAQLLRLILIFGGRRRDD